MNFESETQAGDNFAERVHANQQKLRSNLKAQYDFIICGSGSSGSVVAGRLAENSAVSVLLLEAGGDADVPSVTDARQWVTNIGSERYWEFKAEPNPHLNGRAIPMGMGKVLGGGSSINAMIWARGHKSDWDFFASEAGDPAWDYNRFLIYIAASRTGRGHPIQDIAEAAVRYLFSRCRIRTRPLQPYLREYARLVFRSLKIKTAE